MKSVTPHQIRHTAATALINSGVSLQALMAILGHVSAEMSLRYGRLFDQTVRADYERALTQAKAQLGLVLPSRAPLPLTDISADSNDWKDTPTIKARLAGGYCLRTPAQGACVYANIYVANYLPTLWVNPWAANSLIGGLPFQRRSASSAGEVFQQSDATGDARTILGLPPQWPGPI